METKSQPEIAPSNAIHLYRMRQAAMPAKIKRDPDGPYPSKSYMERMDATEKRELRQEKDAWEDKD